MRSIIVVCLSPAIDRNYVVPSLTPGGLHRCENPVLSPGGKGVNVARILSLLGSKAICIGFFAGDNGQYIVRNLQHHSVIVEPIYIKGETRSSLNILDTFHGKETEILEAGPVVFPDDMKHFVERFRTILSNELNPPVVVFSGGIPRGLEVSIYSELIELAKEYNATCLLDTSSEALLNGLSARPFMIKPNRRELSTITNHRIDCECDITKEYLSEIYKETRAFDIPLIAVTFGSKGAMLCVNDRIYYAHPISMKTVNTIGSGDSFTAGMAYSIANNYPWKKSLEISVACASSNALFEQVGFIDLAQVKDFQNTVIIDEYVFESDYR